LILNNFKFEVLYTPGHTAGGVCYRYNNLIFTGDTIFYNSIGRWDLPTADGQQLFESVRKFINWAKQDDLILSGHDSVYRPYSEVERVNPYIVHFKGVK
jgi:glyoxylase-like metal-dependent hydrolase (beta-lactamase superfamily II)